MRFQRSRRFEVLAALGLLAGISFGQDAPFKPLPAPVPLSEALRSRGVTDLSEDSLIAALKHRDPVVRGFAACELAAEGHSDALPAIEAALSEEKDLQAQANISEALWVLHDPKGLGHLHSMCTDSSTPVVGLLSALQILQLTQSAMGDCAATVLAAMKRERDIGFLAMLAAALPPIYRGASPEQAKAIVGVLESQLSNAKLPFIIRQVSSQSLAQIGVPESAEVIRNAIAQEADSNLRSSFQRDLDALEKRP